LNPKINIHIFETVFFDYFSSHKERLDMANFVLTGSPKTPEVNFNEETGKLELKGRSIPENSIEFYKPMFDWIEAYGSNPKSATEVNIVLEYFNTSSSKCILDLFKKLEALNNGGKTTVTVNWYYEADDEDMLEAGEDYQAIISLKVNMIALEEM
jgi:hypothetical protein